MTYEGEYQNDRPNGKGRFEFANGDKYEGEVRNHEFHGFGRYTKADGSFYEVCLSVSRNQDVPT